MTRHPTRRDFTRGLALAAPALVSAPARPQTPDREALIAAAKKEGRVVV